MAVLRDPEEQETRFLLAHLDLAGAQVLEIGSGEGRLTARLAPHAASYFGFDLSPDRLAVARKLAAEDPAADIPLAVASATAMPYPAGEFDLALLAWSL